MQSKLAVLVAFVFLIVAVAAGCGGSGSDDPESTSTVTVTDSSAPVTDSTTTGETTVGQATDGTATTTSEEGGDGATPPADVQVTSLTGFTSPTGNIGCYIDRKSVRCDIKDRDWSPPPAPSTCETDYGQGIELPAGGAPDFVCAGDTALDGGDPLPYGQSIAAGTLRCESSESDMSCDDAETGRGFTLSIQAYDLR